MLTTNQRMSTDKKRLTPQGQTMGRVAATDMAPQRAAQPNPPQAPQQPRAPAVPATKGSRTSPVFQAGKAPMTQGAINPQQKAVNTMQTAAPGAATGATGNPGIAPQNNVGGIQFNPGSMSPQPTGGITPQPTGNLTAATDPTAGIWGGANSGTVGKPGTINTGTVGGTADPTPPGSVPPLVFDDRTYQQMMQDALMEKLMGGPQTAEEEALINQMMEAQVGQGVADARANMGGGGFAVGGALGALEGDIRREGSLAASGQIADLRQQEEAQWLEQVLGLSGSLQDERELGIYETAFERALKMLEEPGGGGGGGGSGGGGMLDSISDSTQIDEILGNNQYAGQTSPVVLPGSEYVGVTQDGRHQYRNPDGSLYFGPAPQGYTPGSPSPGSGGSGGGGSPSPVSVGG